MAHLDDVRPNAQWAGEMAPGSTDYQRFDDHQSRIVDGDNGGTWTPTGPIGIGGAGVTFDTAATQITGGVTTASGGRVVLANVAGNTPVFTTPMTDTITMPIDEFAFAPTAVLGAGYSWLLDDYALRTSNPYGVQFQQPGVVGFTTLAAVPIPRRYLHQGASFSKIRLHFRIPQQPATNANIPGLAFSLQAFNPSTQTVSTLTPNFFTAPSWTVSNWLAGTNYAVGSYVAPSASLGGWTGFYYKAISTSGTGTSGTNGALFSGVTTVGATVVDNPGPNQITWECWGQSGQYGTAGINAASYCNNAAPQVIELDPDLSTGALLAANAVDHGTYTYGIVIGSLGNSQFVTPDFSVIVHSVDFVFSNIVDLRFT